MLLAATLIDTCRSSSTAKAFSGSHAEVEDVKEAEFIWISEEKVKRKMCL